jgi:hypothetical protein
MVTTGRGIHRYYRMVRCPLTKFLKRDGLCIEFKNAGQYVVGPGSIHPSGAVYQTFFDGQWTDIPVFPADFVLDDGSYQPKTSGAASGVTEGFEFPDEVREPLRHDTLLRYLRSLKARGNDEDVVRAEVTLANQTRCKPPIEEDARFEAWFQRAWNLPDRPLDPMGDRVPLNIDVTTPRWL